MVPIARHSWLKKSVLIHAVLPTDTPYMMTKKMIKMSTTMAAVEMEFCSSSSVEVLTGIQ